MSFLKWSRSVRASLIRAFVFGVEDSIVSTVGLLSGVAIGDMPRNAVILSGVVLIFVEAFSMGAGEFLSESSAEDYEKPHGVHVSGPLLNSIVMFLAYFIAGFLVLVPYLLFSVAQAFWASIGISFCGLFLLGAGNARLSNVSVLKSALRMVAVGGVALMVGIIAAKMFQGIV